MIFQIRNIKIHIYAFDKLLKSFLCFWKIIRKSGATGFHFSYYSPQDSKCGYSYLPIKGSKDTFKSMSENVAFEIELPW